MPHSIETPKINATVESKIVHKNELWLESRGFNPVSTIFGLKRTRNHWSHHFKKKCFGPQNFEISFQGCGFGPESSRRTLVSPIFRSPGNPSVAALFYPNSITVTNLQLRANKMQKKTFETTTCLVFCHPKNPWDVGFGVSS